MIRWVITFALTLFFLNAAALNVMAQENSEAEYSKVSHQVKASIEACWDLSTVQRDSGVTADMREGTIKTTECLEEKILEIARTRYFKNSPESLKRFEESFEAYRTNVPSIFWLLHNEGDHCKGPCGTIGQVLYVGEYAAQLETLLNTMVMIPAQ